MSSPPARGEQTAVHSLIERVAARPDEEATLEGILEVAVEMVPRCRWAGITLRHDESFETVASTDALALAADELQYRLREGPCVEAVWTEDTYRIVDTLADDRFPRWGPGAAELGIRSSLSVRIARSDNGRNVSGLNLYADEPDAFDDEDVHVALAFASRAAAALSVSRQITGLQTALQTRHTIGVAQGILVALHRISVDDAFRVLVRLSRDNNVKLAVLAQEVIDEGAIPRRFRGDQVP